MKKLLYLITFFIFTDSYATDWTYNPDSAMRHSIKISSGYYFASNAITSQFASAYFNNEFISDELKNNVSKNLVSSNHFGAKLDYELSYTRHNDTLFNLPRSFYTVKLGSHYHINSKFKEDAFEIFFRGNKQFAGETADLGDFSYNQIYYQQLNFTFGHRYKFEKNFFEYSAGVSLNKGLKFYNIEAPKATIYTESMGAYLDLDTDLKIRQSDSAKSDLAAWNGTGASINFEFSWKDKKDNVLNFSIDNFGFISWNNKSSYVHADTSFRFEGIDVTSLFLFSDSVKEAIDIDSSLVQPYLSVREYDKHTMLLPSMVKLSYRYNLFPGRMDIEGGINYLFFAGYKLQETLALGFTFNNIHRLSLLSSYGGYTGLNAGIEYKVYIFKYCLLDLRSDFLTGYINPASGKAQGAFVSLTAYF